MRQGHRWAVCCVGFAVGLGVLGGGVGSAQDTVQLTVILAAGPSVESLDSSVEVFRAALGEPDNANNPGPLASGRREINWDGGGNNDTTTPLPPVTPFDVFLDSHGGQFTTPGTGLSQAPPTGGPQGGLAGLFTNPTYGDIFSPFSPLRLFTPAGSNITEAVFFIPGTDGAQPATVSGFGAVFTDVDQQDGTRIEYFGADGTRLFSSPVPASPGDGNLSFFGLVFGEARIARVRITSGTAAPGPDDDAKHDIVVMDDFLYGEPQPLPYAP